MKYIELLDKIKPEWSTMEKVKFLYEQVCINSIYDDRIEFTQDSELILSIYDRDIDITKEQGNKVVCNTICKILQQLLEKIGVKSKLIKKVSRVKRAAKIEDTALIFTVDEKEYFCNPVGDIQHCKYGMMPAYFCCDLSNNPYTEAKNVSTITSKESRRIDRTIGYLPPLKEGAKDDEKTIDSYTDVLFKLLAEEIKNTGMFFSFLKTQETQIPENLNNKAKNEEFSVTKKLEYITKLIKWHEKNVGTNEIKLFYKKLIEATINKSESTKIEFFEFYKEREDNNIDVIYLVELDLQNEPIYYKYSRDDLTYVITSIPELKEQIAGYKERKGKKLLIDKKRR